MLEIDDLVKNAGRIIISDVFSRIGEVSTNEEECMEDLRSDLNGYFY